MPFIGERSMTSPSSQVPSPPPLCPPPRTARVSPCSRAKLTAAITSATSAQRAIRPGCLSIMRVVDLARLLVARVAGSDHRAAQAPRTPHGRGIRCGWCGSISNHAVLPIGSPRRTAAVSSPLCVRSWDASCAVPASSLPLPLAPHHADLHLYPQDARRAPILAGPGVRGGDSPDLAFTVGSAGGTPDPASPLGAGHRQRQRDRRRGRARRSRGPGWRASGPLRQNGSAARGSEERGW